MWICSLMTTDFLGSETEGEFVSDRKELSFPHDSRVQALMIKIINFIVSIILIVQLNVDIIWTEQGL